MKPKFEKKSKPSPKEGKLFIHLMFEGGDADTEHPEEYELPQKFSPGMTLEGEALQTVENYKKLKGILDVNHGDHEEDYSEVEKKWGEEIANLFDNAPNDPQADYQFKCSLDSIKLIGYDEAGNKWEAWI